MINQYLIFKVVIFTVTLVMNTITVAQNFNINKNTDPIKYINTKVYKAKLKKGNIVKGKHTTVFDGYPIKEYNIEKYFNKVGFLVEEKQFGQRNIYSYNSQGSIIRIIRIHNNLTDSLITNYSYDVKGNVKRIENKKTSSKKLFWKGLNVFGEFLDKTYYNFYNLKKTFCEENFNDTLSIKINDYLRRYDSFNNLLEEKYLTLNQNPFPYKPDSTIHIKKYEYNNLNLLKIYFYKRYHKPKFGKNYTTVSKEVYKYDKQGNLLNRIYYDEDTIVREKIFKYDLKGCLNEFIYKNRNSVEKFTYNYKGDILRYLKILNKGRNIEYILRYKYDIRGNWIQRIHLTKKNKPTFLIERDIVYY